ncbi:unnamed protein product [Echinostoma caproni]|uniref:Uncharacterized protein n=1 Tax=Echinostoma caproni TaxID=27848 RepID=A0A3P8E210_9TREM|nr:unnamed protein product [Echinostoma caproni]
MAIGTYRGHVQIWDITKSSCISSLTGHLARVGALAWNADLLASGSRDRYILLRDTRASATTGGGTSEPVRNLSVPSTVTTVPSITTHSDGLDEQSEVDDEDHPPVGDQRVTELMDTSSDDLLSPPPDSTPMVTDSTRPQTNETHNTVRSESGLVGANLDSVLPWSLPSSLMRTPSVVTNSTSSQNTEVVNDRIVRGAVRVLKDHRQEVSFDHS